MFERIFFGIAFVIALVAAMWIPVRYAFSHTVITTPAAFSVTSKSVGGKE
jgi:hypothetical protein